MVVGAMCVWGIALSLHASFPWQEAMWRAGIYLREHPEVRPVGSWNVGIIGFFADDGVTNMDGLMNDAVLPYAKRGDLQHYFYKRGTRYILESPDLWTRRMALRGGYADGALAVEAQEVVPIQSSAGGWGVVVEASMRSVEVVVVEPGLELFGALV